jgi:hypothetical protein
MARTNERLADYRAKCALKISGLHCVARRVRRSEQIAHLDCAAGTVHLAEDLADEGD